MKSEFKRSKVLGPGGMRCVCCGPAPKLRKAFLRTEKRREIVIARKREEKLL